jgi:hypothetical protein
VPIRIIPGLPRFPLPHELPVFLWKLAEAATVGGIGAPPDLDKEDRESILGGLKLPFPGMPIPVIRRSSDCARLGQGKYYALPIPMTLAAYRSLYDIPPSWNTLKAERVGIVKPGAIVWVSLVKPEHGGFGLGLQLIVRVGDVIPLTDENRDSLVL